MEELPPRISEESTNAPESRSERVAAKPELWIRERWRLTCQPGVVPTAALALLRTVLSRTVRMVPSGGDEVLIPCPLQAPLTVTRSSSNGPVLRKRPGKVFAA